ncbi:hypothetical protein AVEN_273371-1 [Araneus ventricosus]|uniref:Transcription and mRNA export factor ENY2 n=1 Tax=Araneus ventricosus TaxID=182803 RepID=A0A4Y2JXD7_ARAVE|nr:hypothetical protein AVEN_273371-1 [Araneus ventricosus]
MAGMRIPACSVDPDEAGSTSQESNMMDYYAASNNWNHASSGVYDINSVEENTNKVRQKLIETGQMDRLKDLMERRLSEVGWRIDMMAKCREIVQINGSKTSYEMLFQPLRQVGKDIVPTEVKEDVLQKIKYCYESETKEN